MTPSPTTPTMLGDTLHTRLLTQPHGTLPKWKLDARKRLMVISPSQIETWRLCKRKWWLLNVRDLIEPAKGSQVFGTVLHSVCERYIEADDLGRDPKTGNPVDLFPPGWEIAASRFGKPSEGSINVVEQDQIKSLIAAAIENGVLERLPGRRIEEQFRLTVLETDAAHVQLMGFIDVAFNDAVWDHKTTKNMRYAKSAAALEVNPQMLIYAHALLEKAKAEHRPEPKSITLRHNAYCKDNPVVRKTFVDVTPAQVYAHWELVKSDAQEMLTLRAEAQTWNQCPDPESFAESCNALGGCPFRDICGGKESENGYELRLDKAMRHAKVQITLTEGSTMSAAPVVSFGSLLSKLAKNKAAPAATVPAPPPVEVASGPATVAPAANPNAGFFKKLAATAPPVQEVAPAQHMPSAAVAHLSKVAHEALASEAVKQPNAGAPPWADPQCTACEGLGFNKSGKACRICDANHAANGLPASNEFIQNPTGNGTLVWQSKADDSIGGESPLSRTPVAKVKAEVREAKAAPAKVEEQAPVTAPAEERETDPDSAVGAVTDAPKGKRGRPAKGFTMVYGTCSRGQDRQGSGRFVHDLGQVMARYGAKLAEESKATNYYNLDAFARRDALCQAASIMAEEFGNDYVQVGVLSPDLRALAAALEPLAGMVWGQATGG